MNMMNSVSPVKQIWNSAASEELKRILTENELDKLDSCLLNMDRNPAAKIDPIKDTPSLNMIVYWIVMKNKSSELTRLD